MKKRFLPIVLIALMLLLVFPTKTYAIWPFDLFTKSTTGSQTKFPTLIQRIIDKFKLNAGEVEKVIEEVRNEKQQEMKARREERLNEAVKAGIITEEQKKALLDKEDEWFKKQTQLMDERRRWMEQSGIDFQKLAPYYRRGFGGKFGGRGVGKGCW